MAEDAYANPGPAEQVSRLYDDLEAQAAKASEELVGSSGFAALLARTAENAAALTKLSGDVMDLVLRNLRLAGRRDVVSLSRQLARTEHKLERVLQEVEELRDELEQAQAPSAGHHKPRGGARAGNARAQAGSTRPARAQSARGDKPAARAASRRRKEPS